MSSFDFKRLINEFMTTTLSRRFYIFEHPITNDFRWVDESTRGLARVKGCPCRSQHILTAMSSSGVTGSKPDVICDA